MGKDAALRGVWIDIVEMFEVGRIFEISESRHAVALGDLCCFDIAGDRRCERNRAKQERFATCSSRAPIIEAFRACLLSAARNEGAWMDRSSPLGCMRAMIKSRWAAPYARPTFY